MAQHQLVMRTGPTPGKVFELTGAELTLGREPGNDIVINDAEISRKHARLSMQGASYMLEDLGSTNGTFVNGQRIMGPHELRPGEIVSFGEQISCTYEQVGVEPPVDPNATIISGKGMTTAAAMAAVTPPPPPPPTAPQPMPASQPRPAATPAPSQPRPAPPPASYAGKVPAGPEKPPAKPPAKKGGSGRIVAIVIAVLIICLLCACIGFFVWIDSDKTGSRWCQYFPFIVNLIGGSCG